ncbi:MAG: hypothetical protein H6684_00640 [Deltaproteobacteria bacterium]|nr:hypothetical protein [bacterium]MCB9476080.1 hypothetical protein [Deltaproteobacteria bacterium]MCB9478230.1 hypothetical protein [Deltaproteobacteria bacterium]MCB9487217.1 hypothetical protein [Deltaproteobacteria bacterium]
MRIWFLALLVLALAASTALADFPRQTGEDDDDADDGSDDDDDGEIDWGEHELDHELNVPWDYPSEYIQRPLVYNKRVTEFSVGFSYKSAKYYYDEDGNLVEGGFQTKKQTFDFMFGMGLTDRWSFRINFPFVYKKTRISDPDSPNYRTGQSNVYGTLGEEAIADHLDQNEVWDLWNADLPWLGDIDLWTGYSLWQKLEPTRSLIAELNFNIPTANDNPRRGTEIRNYLGDGTPDLYLGLGYKHEQWKFSFEGHAGYNIRMKADTKHSPGTLDPADEVKADGEIAFQIPEVQPLWNTMAIVVAGHYRERVGNFRWEETTEFDYVDSTIRRDRRGNTLEFDDTPGYLASVEPKVIFEKPEWWGFDWFDGDWIFFADIPVAGQQSFLPVSRSFYYPPYELEHYEAVGITYGLSLVKRWQ